MKNSYSHQLRIFLIDVDAARDHVRPFHITIYLQPATNCTLTGAARSTVTPRSKVSGSTLMDTDLDGSFTVLDLKALVSDMTEMPVDEMRVLHKGRALHDDDTLDACGASAALANLLVSHQQTDKSCMAQSPGLWQACATARSCTSRSTRVHRPTPPTCLRVRWCRNPARAHRPIRWRPC